MEGNSISLLFECSLSNNDQPTPGNPTPDDCGIGTADHPPSPSRATDGYLTPHRPQRTPTYPPVQTSKHVRFDDSGSYDFYNLHTIVQTPKLRTLSANLP